VRAPAKANGFAESLKCRTKAFSAGTGSNLA